MKRVTGIGGIFKSLTTNRHELAQIKPLASEEAEVRKIRVHSRLK
jgi:hypothetical protein